MWKRINILICLLVTCLSSYAYAERNLLQLLADKEQLKAVLLTDQSWVPYPSYRERSAWDQYLGKYKKVCIERGMKLLDYKWQVVKATDYIEFAQSGNRNIMQDPSDANTNAVLTLMLAELAEGKGRFIPQLMNGVYFLCEMTSWAFSAHLAGSQLSHRPLPDYDDTIIDLVSSDVGGLMSWVYYFFHKEFDEVTPQISKRMLHEIYKRHLEPYMHSDRYWWMAFNFKPGNMINNWNPWCNFNILQSFFLLESDRDKLADAVYRTMISVDRYLNYVHADGACEEGPSYWKHAAGKVLDYLEMLYRGTGGKISLFDNPQIRNMGEYISHSYVGDGWVVNFADASARGGGNSHLIYRYGQSIGSNNLEQFAAYLYDKDSLSWNGRDIYRILEALRVDKELQETVATGHKTPAFMWYPETEFCYFSNERAFVAAKGGHNNESHNHNDVGTFSLWVNHVPIIIDAGVGTYTRQTFSSERYSIWTMQSDYHNLPMINGIPQKHGRKYKATDIKATAKEFSVNLATAYPQEAEVTEWIRSYSLRRNRLTIKDRFSLASVKAPNQINFLTWGEVGIEEKEGIVTICINDVKVKLQFNNKLFDVNKEKIVLTDSRLANVWGKQIYRLSFTAKQLSKKDNYLFSVDF